MQPHAGQPLHTPPFTLRHDIYKVMVEENLSNGHATNGDAVRVTSFVLSAPGKVIVYGEHAVVYGKVS